jgi:hypothetical protein
MTSLSLSANVNGTISGVSYNDLYLDADGNISVSYDLQAVLEECSEAAKTLLGELIFNTSVGVPYAQTVWSGVPNISQFTSALRQTLLSVPEVNEVLSIVTGRTAATIHAAPNQPTVTYTAIISTIYGNGAING